MRTRFRLAAPFLLLAAAQLVLGLAPPPAAAQGLAGDWWIRIKGKEHRGAGWLTFTDAGGGSFAVTGYGSTVGLGAMFEVDAGQTVVLGPDGILTGMVDIVDAADTLVSLGTFDFEKGKVKKNGASLKIRGTFSDGGDPAKVRIKGTRFPSTSPVLTGRDADGRLKGKKVKGRPYDLRIHFATDDPCAITPDLCAACPATVPSCPTPACPLSAPTCPAYMYLGSGTAEIDGVDVPDVCIGGCLALDPRGKVFGTLESALGTGTARGGIKEGDEDPRANLRLETNRRFKARGDLGQPVSPILSVEPSVPLDFGSVPFGTPADQTFMLSNVGDTTQPLSGEITPTDQGDAFFVAEVDMVPCASMVPCPYTIAPGAGSVIEVKVTFQPIAEGPASDQIVFTGGGGAVRDVTGVATTLAVEPASLDFGNVMVGNDATLSFTVRNDGMTPITGSATVTTGVTEFELVDAGGMVQAQINYTLAPAAMDTVRVRFTPASTGVKNGVVTFTGGGGDQTRNVTGNGT